MPEKTLDAVRDHSEIAGDQVTNHYDDAEQVMAALKDAGVDYDDVIAVLEQEGVEKFVDVLERAPRHRRGPARAGPEPR